MPFLAILIEAQVRERRGETESRRKGVLLLADPCDRFDAYRVERKNQAGKAGAGQGEPARDGHDQAGRSGVQEEIDPMITGGGRAPQAKLQPECAVQQRIILLGRSELRPDAPQSVEGVQRLRADVPIVVPQKSAAERGGIDEGGGAKNRKPAGGRGHPACARYSAIFICLDGYRWIHDGYRAETANSH